MSISFTRYINIISGVGGGAPVAMRELITRIFTINPLLPTQSFIEFANAQDVATYFGSSSEEYLRAAQYFAYISPNITAPQKLSFARWASAAVGSLIYGIPSTYALGAFTPITTGDFTLKMGGFTTHVTGVNLGAAGSLSAVATAIQTAIRAVTANGAAWTGATVTFDAVRGSFNLVGGTTGADTISVLPGTVTDLIAPLGWGVGATFSNGSAAETLTNTLINSVNASNNFGSFLFMTGSAFTTPQHLEIATYNATQNNMFQYLCCVTAANAAAVSAALINIPGVAMTLKGAVPGEYHEMAPGMIEASTDYSRRNSVVNYMYKQFAFTPSVTTDALANTYDALRVNYYGVTQTAGQLLAFYQRGVLTGGNTAPTDQNTYANEQWLKSAVGTALMALLLSLAKVSANIQGISQINAVLQSAIDLAVFNGTISVGKTLTRIQQLYITNATGSDKAWYQVQTIGYWVGVSIVSYVAASGATEYKAVYTLIYSKDDDIRKIDGTHVLI